MKEIDLKEFKEKGYLQEVNRRFFHPLGLALQFKMDENDNYFIEGFNDFREDKEGIIFDIKNSDPERKEDFIKRKKYIDSEFKRIQNIRGFLIEEIEDYKKLNYITVSYDINLKIPKALCHIYLDDLCIGYADNFNIVNKRITADLIFKDEKIYELFKSNLLNIYTKTVESEILFLEIKAV